MVRCEVRCEVRCTVAGLRSVVWCSLSDGQDVGASVHQDEEKHASEKEAWQLGVVLRGRSSGATHPLLPCRPSRPLPHSLPYLHNEVEELDHSLHNLGVKGQQELHDVRQHVGLTEDPLALGDGPDHCVVGITGEGTRNEHTRDHLPHPPHHLTFTIVAFATTPSLSPLPLPPPLPSQLTG